MPTRLPVRILVPALLAGALSAPGAASPPLPSPLLQLQAAIDAGLSTTGPARERALATMRRACTKLRDRPDMARDLLVRRLADGCFPSGFDRSFPFAPERDDARGRLLETTLAAAVWPSPAALLAALVGEIARRPGHPDPRMWHAEAFIVFVRDHHDRATADRLVELIRASPVENGLAPLRFGFLALSDQRSRSTLDTLLDARLRALPLAGTGEAPVERTLHAFAAWLDQDPVLAARARRAWRTLALRIHDELEPPGWVQLGEALHLALARELSSKAIADPEPAGGLPVSAWVTRMLDHLISSGSSTRSTDRVATRLVYFASHISMDRAALFSKLSAAVKRDPGLLCTFHRWGVIAALRERSAALGLVERLVLERDRPERQACLLDVIRELYEHPDGSSDLALRQIILPLAQRWDDRSPLRRLLLVAVRGRDGSWITPAHRLTIASRLLRSARHAMDPLPLEDGDEPVLSVVSDIVNDSACLPRAAGGAAISYLEGPLEELVLALQPVALAPAGLDDPVVDRALDRTLATWKHVLNLCPDSDDTEELDEEPDAIDRFLERVLDTLGDRTQRGRDGATAADALRVAKLVRLLVRLSLISGDDDVLEKALDRLVHDVFRIDGESGPLHTTPAAFAQMVHLFQLVDRPLRDAIAAIGDGDGRSAAVRCAWERLYLPLATRIPGFLERTYRYSPRDTVHDEDPYSALVATLDAAAARSLLTVTVHRLGQASFMNAETSVTMLLASLCGRAGVDLWSDPRAVPLGGNVTLAVLHRLLDDHQAAGFQARPALDSVARLFLGHLADEDLRVKSVDWSTGTTSPPRERHRRQDYLPWLRAVVETWEAVSAPMLDARGQPMPIQMPARPALAPVLPAGLTRRGVDGSLRAALIEEYDRLPELAVETAQLAAFLPNHTENARAASDLSGWRALRDRAMTGIGRALDRLPRAAAGPRHELLRAALLLEFSYREPSSHGFAALVARHDRQLTLADRVALALEELKLELASSGSARPGDLARACAQVRAIATLLRQQYPALARTASSRALAVHLRALDAAPVLRSISESTVIQVMLLFDPLRRALRAVRQDSTSTAERTLAVRCVRDTLESFSFLVPTPSPADLAALENPHALAAFSALDHELKAGALEIAGNTDPVVLRTLVQASLASPAAALRSLESLEMGLAMFRPRAYEMAVPDFRTLSQQRVTLRVTPARMLESALADLSLALSALARLRDVSDEQIVSLWFGQRPPIAALPAAFVGGTPPGSVDATIRHLSTIADGVGALTASSPATARLVARIRETDPEGAPDPRSQIETALDHLRRELASLGRESNPMMETAVRCLRCPMWGLQFVSKAVAHIDAAPAGSRTYRRLTESALLVRDRAALREGIAGHLMALARRRGACGQSCGVCPAGAQLDESTHARAAIRNLVRGAAVIDCPGLLGLWRAGGDRPSAVRQVVCRSMNELVNRLYFGEGSLSGSYPGSLIWDRDAGRPRPLPIETREAEAEQEYGWICGMALECSAVPGLRSVFLDDATWEREMQ